MGSLKQLWNGDKQKQVVLFSSTAIALYGMLGCFLLNRIQG